LVGSRKAPASVLDALLEVGAKAGTTTKPTNNPNPTTATPTAANVALPNVFIAIWSCLSFVILTPLYQDQSAIFNVKNVDIIES
jgi:hypothetical protein